MLLTKEQMEKLGQTPPMDDLAIRFMLRDNLEPAKLLCHTVLEATGLRVKSVRTQYDVSRGGIARAVTMDAVIVDKKDWVRNYEIQADHSKQKSIRCLCSKYFFEPISNAEHPACN